MQIECLRYERVVKENERLKREIKELEGKVARMEEIDRVLKQEVENRRIIEL
jgi:cell division septum initiation protein DivIVA